MLLRVSARAPPLPSPEREPRYREGGDQQRQDEAYSHRKGSCHRAVIGGKTRISAQSRQVAPTKKQECKNGLAAALVGFACSVWSRKHVNIQNTHDYLSYSSILQHWEDTTVVHVRTARDARITLLKTHPAADSVVGIKWWCPGFGRELYLAHDSIFFAGDVRPFAA